jgi:hypothetical protein
MKNYLLMADETSMAILRQLVPALQFIEIVGYNVKDIENLTFLTTQRIQPVVTELNEDVPELKQDIKDE